MAKQKPTRNPKTMNTQRSPKEPEHKIGRTRATNALANAIVSKKGQSCRTLQSQFTLKGFKYRQIAREGDKAIYEQTWVGATDPSVCYEVIKIRRHGAFEIAGKHFPAYEAYPTDRVWGIDGFTVTDKDAAFAKMGEMK